tara:strand:- start:19575 stop:20516 length:942 start_codon:yes stop_codon:yes gene_type:complete
MFISSDPEDISDHFSLNKTLSGGIPIQSPSPRHNDYYDWEIPPWELFIFENHVLGEGSFGKVYLAKWRETFVVAKIINHEVCENKEFILREIDIMTKLHHPNIVQFLGYINVPFIIIMEYIPNGNLLEQIKNLKYKKKLSIMMDVLQGLAYFHNRRPQSLIHRDIKPTNILLTPSYRAKITDFGISKLYSLERKNSFTGIDVINKESELTADVGTMRYRAPETYNSNIEYDNKVDIYSFGVLLYEMFEVRRHVPDTPMVWKKCSSDIKNLIIENMLCGDPYKRSSALELIHKLKIIKKNKKPNLFFKMCNCLK